MRRKLLVVFPFLLMTIGVSAQTGTPASDLPLTADQWAAQGIAHPELISREKAEFPVEARLQQSDGVCLVSMVVSAQGNPQNVRIVHCTDTAFEQGSLNAVDQYRFKPATTREGAPVPVEVRSLLLYHSAKYVLSLHMLIDWQVVPDKRVALDRRMSKGEARHEVSKPVHSGFIPLRGGASVPDSDGVYPFTRDVTGPRVIRFSDQGYGPMAFVHDGNSTCDIELTVSTKGRASDPKVTHCERPELEKPAVDSLLKSQYMPGMVRGKEVPMRGSIHLEYGVVADARPVPPQ